MMNQADNPCPNFRDVGAWINVILDQDVMREGVLFRGGKIELVSDPCWTGHARSIVNLRRGDDTSGTFGADYWHFPTTRDTEVYDTTDHRVIRWLGQILGALAGEVEHDPILIHCVSGKDRTGVAVAALLAGLRIPYDAIIEEYLLSDGEVARAWIEQSLDGLGSIRSTLKGVDWRALGGRFLSP